MKTKFFIAAVFAGMLIFGGCEPTITYPVQTNVGKYRFDVPFTMQGDTIVKFTGNPGSYFFSDSTVFAFDIYAQSPYLFEENYQINSLVIDSCYFYNDKVMGNDNVPVSGGFLMFTATYKGSPDKTLTVNLTDNSVNVEDSSKAKKFPKFSKYDDNPQSLVSAFNASINPNTTGLVSYGSLSCPAPTGSQCIGSIYTALASDLIAQSKSLSQSTQFRYLAFKSNFKVAHIPNNTNALKSGTFHFYMAYHMSYQEQH